MKKGKGIQITLSNRMSYTIIVLGVIILLGMIVYAGNYINPTTLVGHDAEEIGDGVIANTIMINGTTGRVGIRTDNPQAELHIVGKIISNPTTDADSADTLVTKSYITSYFRYTACGWRSGFECDDGELMTGWQSTPQQVKCCGTGVFNCTPADWTTYNGPYCSATCNVGWECGTASGTLLNDQKRTLDDCQVEYRTINTGINCNKNCGITCAGGTFCNPVTHRCESH